MSKKGKVGGFLGGALVGLGLGFLFAPKSGEETRKELGNKLSDLWDKVRGMDADEIKDKLEKKLKEIEKDLKELESALESGKIGFFKFIFFFINFFSYVGLSNKYINFGI